MSFTLGFTPEKFKLVVAAGSDFYASLVRSDGNDWSDSAELILDFADGATWTADLSGATATWDVDQDDVDVVIALKPKKVRLWYVDGETRTLWAQGSLVAT